MGRFRIMDCDGCRGLIMVVVACCGCDMGRIRCGTSIILVDGGTVDVVVVVAVVLVDVVSFIGSCGDSVDTELEFVEDVAVVVVVSLFLAAGKSPKSPPYMLVFTFSL